MSNTPALDFDAAVIIPHYNDTQRLARCLTALQPQVGPHVDVVIVDNASSEPLDEITSKFPEFRFVTEPLKGAACARNRGVQESSADRLFFLDCDCVPASDWLATAMRITADADVIGGAINLFDETPAPRTGAEAFETVFAFDNKAYIENKNFSVTANLLTTRHVFDATGPFVPGLSEDLDWCQRAVNAGYQIRYDDTLQVSHPTRSDWLALRKKWLRLTAEGFQVNGTSVKKRVVWAIRAIGMPASVLAHIPRVLRNTDLLSTRERVAALITLFRLRIARCGWMLRQSVSPHSPDHINRASE